MSGRLGIDDVSPVVSAGRYPAKAVVGEHIPVQATVWREGHDKLAATVTWRGPNDRVARQTRMHEVGIGLDRWGATVVPDHEGAWTFRMVRTGGRSRSPPGSRRGSDATAASRSRSRTLRAAHSCA